MRILSLDYSFAKTGWSITDIKEKPDLIACGLIKSNTNLDVIERIDYHIADIEKIYRKYNPDLVLKEGAIIGRSSTAMNVIKAHAVLEYIYYQRIRPLENIHNATVKAVCRKILSDNEIDYKLLDKKLIVAKAVELYYGRKIPEIWNKNGKPIDDISDSIAIAIAYYKKNIKNDA